MTIEQRIQRQIIINSLAFGEPPVEVPKEINESNIEEIYSALDGHDYLQDAAEEFRTSGEETGIKCDWSRHYESESVAKKLDDGTWVGWTHWHGGGKHGEPGAIDWMDSAYELSVTEEPKTVIVRTFSKK